MTDHTPSVDRRTALQALGSLTLAGVAGCLGNSSNSPSSTDSTSPFTSVDVQGTTLVTDLDSTADVGAVTLVAPDGSLFGKRTIEAGVSRVSFDVGTSYTPGQYTLTAVNGDKTLGTTTQSLRPDLQIVEMGIGRNQPEQMWNGTQHRTGVEAFVTVTNQGSGPTAITKLLFMGFVPYPSGVNGTTYANATDVSGIYSPDSDSEVDRTIVSPGEQETIYSYRAPFAFGPGANVTCANHRQQGTFKTILETSVGERDVSQTYSIEYSASEQFDNCSMTIKEQ